MNKMLFAIIFSLSLIVFSLPIAYNVSQKEQFIIKEGILAEKRKNVKFYENRKLRAIVKLKDPVVVSQSDKPLEWGYYQFPSMYRMEDGNILVTWQMKEDDYKTLGGKEKGKNMMLSTDNGKTWKDYDNRYSLEQYYYSLKKENGECLQITNNVSNAVSYYEDLPKPVYKFEEFGTKYTYYKASELPIDLQRITLKKWQLSNSVPSEIQRIQLSIKDSALYRCANDDYYFSLWLGKMRELSNKDVLMCSSVSYHTDNNGKILKRGISFYKLNDKDNNLSFQGEMPFTPNLEIDPSGEWRKAAGFSEPAFIELDNGRLLCVTRSSYESSITPMYKSFSDDEGKTWTTPKAFTPNGVDPYLLRLGNGTLVLASGRPGVQLRFCFDGDGEKWTIPVEMMVFPKKDGKIVTFGGSCGYTDLIPIDDNSFYIVYSVFGREVNKGEYYKSIVIRKVSVKLKK